MMFDDNEMEESHIYGGGKEEYSELVEQCLTKVHAKKMSSTRMEALALLGLMVAMRYFDPDHLLDFLHLCDSETTINTYKKLRKLNRMQLPKLPNSDVWMMINEYRKHWSRKGPGLYSIEHVPSHMDDYMKKAGGTEDDLTPEWKANIMADKLADEYNSEEQSTINNGCLAKHFPGFMYHKGKPVVVPFGKWAKEHVTLGYIKTYFVTHHEVALRGIDIDWSRMRSVSKQRKHLWQRSRAMRIIWELFAFNHTKMMRGHCKPSEVDCAFCGNAVETQKHVLASCQDPDILEIKQELFNDIVLLVADEVPKTLSVWLRENVEHIWGGDLGKITYATMTEVEYTEGVNLHEIHTCAWNGIIPKELVKLVQKLLSNSKHWA